MIAVIQHRVFTDGIYKDLGIDYVVLCNTEEDAKRYNKLYESSADPNAPYRVTEAWIEPDFDPTVMYRNRIPPIALSCKEEGSH